MEFWWVLNEEPQPCLILFQSSRFIYRLDGRIKPNTSKRSFNFPPQSYLRAILHPLSVRRSSSIQQLFRPQTQQLPLTSRTRPSPPYSISNPSPNYQQVLLTLAACTAWIRLLLYHSHPSWSQPGVSPDCQSPPPRRPPWSYSCNEIMQALPGKALGTKYSVNVNYSSNTYYHRLCIRCMLSAGKTAENKPVHGKCNNPVWYMPWKEKYWVFLRSMQAEVKEGLLKEMTLILSDWDDQE